MDGVADLLIYSRCYMRYTGMVKAAASEATTGALKSNIFSSQFSDISPKNRFYFSIVEQNQFRRLYLNPNQVLVFLFKCKCHNIHYTNRFEFLAVPTQCNETILVYLRTQVLPHETEIKNFSRCTQIPPLTSSSIR